MSLPASFVFISVFWPFFVRLLVCALFLACPGVLQHTNPQNGTDPISLHDYDTVEGAPCPCPSSRPEPPGIPHSYMAHDSGSSCRTIKIARVSVSQLKSARSFGPCRCNMPHIGLTWNMQKIRPRGNCGGLGPWRGKWIGLTGSTETPKNQSRKTWESISI